MGQDGFQVFARERRHAEIPRESFTLFPSRSSRPSVQNQKNFEQKVAKSAKEDRLLKSNLIYS
jgi:hypothetical protein